MADDRFRFEYAWKWFEYHAKQRQQNIQFSIALLTATLASVGYLTIADEYFIALLASLIGMTASRIFYGLDCRNSALVKLAEAELAKFEASFGEGEHKLEIFCAADDTNKFMMIKYSTAAKLLYGVFFSAFLISSLATVYQYFPDFFMCFHSPAKGVAFP